MNCYIKDVFHFYNMYMAVVSCYFVQFCCKFPTLQLGLSFFEVYLWIFFKIFEFLYYRIGFDNLFLLTNGDLKTSLILRTLRFLSSLIYDASSNISKVQETSNSFFDMLQLFNIVLNIKTVLIFVRFFPLVKFCVLPLPTQENTQEQILLFD